MIQKLKRTYLTQKCKLSKRALQVKEQVSLVFSKKEAETKTDVTVGNTYQI